MRKTEGKCQNEETIVQVALFMFFWMTYYYSYFLGLYLKLLTMFDFVQNTAVFLGYWYFP